MQRSSDGLQDFHLNYSFASMKLYRLLFSIFLFSLFSVQLLFAQQIDLRSTITVTGDAIVKAVPDQVVLSLSVETNNMDIDKARSENDSKISAILAMVRKLGIEDKQLQTDYLNIEPRYDYLNGNAQRFKGYFVKKNITVILNDISKSDKLIAEALKLGTNYVQSVNFESTQLKKYQAEARLQAIRSAKEKAIALAGELGQKIKKPITITEDYQGKTTMRGNRNMSNDYQTSTYEAFDLPSSGNSTIALGEINIQSKVTVIFEME